MSITDVSGPPASVPPVSDASTTVASVASEASKSDQAKSDQATSPVSPEPDLPARRSRPALSPSRANDFKQCPLLYRFRAIDRIPEKSTAAQVKGNVVHAALEALYEMPSAERHSDKAVSLIEPAWERVLGESPQLAELITGDELRTLLDQARGLVSGYYEMEDPTRFDPEACEQRVEIELSDGTPLRGFIDRIDVAKNGMLRVVDYKTGKAPREFTEAKALFQMKFYALVVMRMRGIVPAQLKLMYLADKQSLTYKPDEGELLRFERMLSAIWTAILAAGESGNFQAKRGKLCSWCDHQALCPEFGGTPPAYPGWPANTDAANLLVSETGS